MTSRSRDSRREAARAASGRQPTSLAAARGRGGRRRGGGGRRDPAVRRRVGGASVRPSATSPARAPGGGWQRGHRGPAAGRVRDPADDPAVGQTIPTVTSAPRRRCALDGGRPKVLLFLAHWCPHCQPEVPLVQAWLDSGGLPADVDLIDSRPRSTRPAQLPARSVARPRGLDAAGHRRLDQRGGERVRPLGLPVLRLRQRRRHRAGRLTGELPTADLDASRRAGHGRLTMRGPPAREPGHATPSPHCAAAVESVWDSRVRRGGARSGAHPVVVDGRDIADSSGRRVLETSQPPVYYLPPDDVRIDLLVAGGGRRCAMEGRGVVRTWSWATRIADVAWRMSAD